MGTEELSNGSPHFGSESERQTQHLIPSPKQKMHYDQASIKKTQNQSVTRGGKGSSCMLFNTIDFYQLQKYAV